MTERQNMSNVTAVRNGIFFSNCRKKQKDFRRRGRGRARGFCGTRESSLNRAIGNNNWNNHFYHHYDQRYQKQPKSAPDSQPPQIAPYPSNFNRRQDSQDQEYFDNRGRGFMTSVNSFTAHRKTKTNRTGMDSGANATSVWGKS